MSAIPPYPYPHSGTLLVIGSAHHCAEDVVMARQMRPHARVMLVNFAAGWYPGDFVCSSHPDRMAEFRAMQAAVNPLPFTTHSAKWARDLRVADYPAVDHFWPGCASRASSTFAGVRIGHKMGFREIIVCCAPMDESFDAASGPGVAREHRRGLLEECEFFSDVRAMSGYPRKILGAPEDLNHGAV